MYILWGKVSKRAVGRWGQGNSCSYWERKSTWFKEQKVGADGGEHVWRKPQLTEGIVAKKKLMKTAQLCKNDGRKITVY